MYRMTPGINDAMIPQDEYMVPHSFLSEMGRGHMEKESLPGTQQRPASASLKAVKLVKKYKRKTFPYLCHVASCGEKFFNSKSLDTHLKLHLGVKPFICNLCGKVCLTESKLKVHQASHVNDGVKPVCDLCERSFSSRSSLNKHKKMLHKPKPHVCPQCHSGFEERKYMVIHAKQGHDLDLPLEVEEAHLSCSENFSTKPYDSSKVSDSSEDSCKQNSICSDNISSSGSEVSSESHNPGKDYESASQPSIISRRDVLINCELCTSTFPSLAYLEQHMAVHISEKVFSCNSCALDFTTQIQFMNHMKMHSVSNRANLSSFTHPDVKSPQLLDKYMCTVCKESFQNLGSLKRHQAKGHCTPLMNSGM